MFIDGIGVYATITVSRLPQPHETVVISSSITPLWGWGGGWRWGDGQKCGGRRFPSLCSKVMRQTSCRLAGEIWWFTTPKFWDIMLLCQCPCKPPLYVTGRRILAHMSWQLDVWCQINVTTHLWADSYCVILRPAGTYQRQFAPKNVGYRPTHKTTCIHISHP